MRLDSLAWVSFAFFAAIAFAEGGHDGSAARERAAAAGAPKITVRDGRLVSEETLLALKLHTFADGTSLAVLRVGNKEPGDDGLYYSSGSRQDILLARYLPDGKLDPAFGSGGFKAIDWLGGLKGLNPEAATVDEDGSVLVSGSFCREWVKISDPAFRKGICDADIFVAKITREGKPARFGPSGKGYFTHDLGTQEETAPAIAVVKGKKPGILVGFNSRGGHGQSAGSEKESRTNQEFGGVLKLKPDGTIDTHYGGFGPIYWRDRGLVQIEPGQTVTTGIHAQPDGSAVVVGMRYSNTIRSAYMNFFRTAETRVEEEEVPAKNSIFVGQVDAGGTLRAHRLFVPESNASAQYSLPRGSQGVFVVDSNGQRLFASDEKLKGRFTTRFDKPYVRVGMPVEDGKGGLLVPAVLKRDESHYQQVITRFDSQGNQDRSFGDGASGVLQVGPASQKADLDYDWAEQRFDAMSRGSDGKVFLGVSRKANDSYGYEFRVIPVLK